jgi:hypothetical protein
MGYEPILDFQITPTLEAILLDNDTKYIVPFHVQLISGATILAHELCTNANAKIKFVPFCLTFHNVEGATRIIYLYTLAPKILYASSVLTATSFIFNNLYQILFDKIGFSGAMINAASTMTFNGLRITLN